MKLIRGLSLSILIHGLLFSGGAGYLAWKNTQAGLVMEVDLLNSSLLQRPKSAAGRLRVMPSEPWYLTTGKPVAQAVLKAKAPLPAEPAEEQTTATENQTGNGGVTEETWFPAAAAARIPEWVDGIITEDDYPAAARRQGKEGRVVATVSIDSTGRVRDAEITEGSYPEFNQLVLERLKGARFRPARDQNDHPISVRMSIPIVFELR